MKKVIAIGFSLLLFFIGSPSLAGNEKTPLESLKTREWKYKDVKGEVSLGNVMTLNYPAYGVDPDERHHPFLLELTDVLKTPLRQNYRMTLRGYSDSSGPSETNRNLSRKRAENLKKVLIHKYFMDPKRIFMEAYGEAAPVASNETADGRMQNRRVEIHIHGDVSEAVLFIDKR